MLFVIETKRYGVPKRDRHGTIDPKSAELISGSKLSVVRNIADKYD